MAYVKINYHNFSTEELRKLIKIHTNIAYPLPEETVYLPIESGVILSVHQPNSVNQTL